MRKLKILVLLFLIASLFAQNDRIAVLELKSENITEPEVKAITERMRTSLVKYDFLKVMERSKIKDLLQEQSYQYQAYFSEEEAVKAGRMVGANYILAGSVQELESGYYVSARLIEVETTTTIAQQDLMVHNKNFSSILQRIPELADKIIRQYAEKRDIDMSQYAESQPTEIKQEETDQEPAPGSLASQTETYESDYSARQGGGFGPCAASCLLGPRVGLELNEGQDIHTSEWVAFAGSMLGSGLSADPGLGSAIFLGTRAYMAYDRGYKANGMSGCITSFFLGPRIGNELDTRRIRDKEWLLLIPCVNLYPAISIPLEAFDGQTMTMIEKREGLRK